MSKGLQAFDNIKRVMTKLFGSVERNKIALSIIEKELKIIEIIRNKNKIINENITGGCFMYMELTKEEYDLLKEVLL